ncbi:putative phosphoenolpyruvate synthase [Nephila pilipes]|uniref:Putative phosphoenolpyruvate synthase n=1 Tax=Nephila pilipes TaxID=299642 RepID=A0A8X6MM78_NEPPI|nr:putative phosphoenolpyruvate synthase [Nephila pilipes]
MVSLIEKIITFPLEFVYWLKWIIAYVAIRIHNFFCKRRFDLYDLKAVGDPVKLGYIVPQLEKDLESPFPESHLQESNDEVTFYGVNSKSECLFVRISRGCNQTADAWIQLKLANGERYSLMETMGVQQSSEGKCEIFSCGKLQMHYLSPMRRWRIFYCGMLKQADEDIEKSVFVKFAFLWSASSDVYDCTLHTNPKGFADSMAKSEWKLLVVPPIIRFIDALNFYAQTGVLRGTVSVNDEPEHEMYLFGEKMRNLGNSESIVGCKFTTMLGNAPANGLTFHLSNISAQNDFNNLPVGFVIASDGIMATLKDLDVTIATQATGKTENLFEANFLAGERYELEGKILDTIRLDSSQGWSGSLQLSFIEFVVKNQKGYGLFISGNDYKKPNRTSGLAPCTMLPEFEPPFTVKFTDEISHFREISGGKGASLGKLTRLSKDNEFIVPNGIVVTTSAYDQFLNMHILKAVERLEKVAYENESGDLREACNKVTSVVENSLLPKRICNSIAADLLDTFKTDVNQLKFAVRSSATGEDGTVMSVAGQMETFLGVQGLDQIFMAVKKCWASQFGYIAVEYKRRNGQVLNSPMAVVIQEMVACEASGVLFTLHPVTSDPSVITITANYGLGETVVSGAVDPDNIVLRRKENDALELGSVDVGMKKQKMVMLDSGGTATVELDENSGGKSCLSKEAALRLGEIAIKIENHYKCPCDIEWGILKEYIYILQSRPITTAAAVTDFEIKHEFDAPLQCENQYLSVANVGEVMPGAVSTLGMELTLKYFNSVLQKIIAGQGFVENLFSNKYFSSGMFSFYNHLMIAPAEMIAQNGIDTVSAKAFMISVFGRILEDPELFEYAKTKQKTGFKATLKMKIEHYWHLATFDFGFEKIRRKVYNHPLNFVRQNTARETFETILKTCSDFDDAGLYHMSCTNGSSDWNMWLFSILHEARGSFDDDVYSDFSNLVRSPSGVESVSVPQEMQEVANEIVAAIGDKTFSSLSVEEAEKWLRVSTSPAGHKFRQFLKRHGHRCIKETDVRSITWALDPKQLVKLLQDLAASTKREIVKEDDSISNIISQLRVPLSFISKCLLRFLVVPQCRRGVKGREAGKSLSMKSFNCWRMAYLRLGRLMVAEGRLPDADLLFFLTLDEIKDLLNTRSPKIILRASHRRRLFPILDKYKFPEIMKGLPKPINGEDSEESHEFIADLTMKGTPVCSGVTKGYARVAVTLAEATDLKPGEILITYSTDIAWSPYFPIISGVVTEIGGLISHGAVVSREYGLPCIVGLQGVTRKFYTGDYVLLDGKKGILQRLPQPQIGQSEESETPS